MLSSLKKWVQDVAVDLTPPPPTSSSLASSSSIPGSTHHYFYSTTPLSEQHGSRQSSSSAVNLSRPISLDSVRSSKTNSIFIPPPLVSPAELDLSHLNREEQEHIANVLKRARAVEEQQQSTLPSMTMPSFPSLPVSISSSLSSSTSTSSFTSEQLEKYDNNEIRDEAEKTITPSESILPTIYQCQICGREHQKNSMVCFPCQENELMDGEIENNNTFLNQQLIPINTLLSDNNHEEDKIYDTIKTTNHEEIQSDINSNQSILHEISRTNNLTEIDENEFFYDEPSPYEAAIISNENMEEESIPSYQIDELIDDDDHDERDHVKELEETIANLSRHFPSEHIQIDSSLNKIDPDSILEMEIEPSSIDKLSFRPSNLPISVPSPMNDRRGSLSRSSGIKENLTDLLIPTTSTSHQVLQRTLSIHSKCMVSINRHKRNLPSVPSTIRSNRLQLRRANSESRFSLPAVPFSPQQNLDDECDLLEIDLNDLSGSMNRTLRSTLEPEFENNQYQITSKGKQIRDQTTNTPPISNLNSSIKLKKKLKKKTSSITKLQKSTSTEITYPFPVTKLILNPSRHGISTDLGFRITGGHSNPSCMEVTACIENININHRNYQILQNIVQEGDEVLELGGVSLRGKSALFVENLMSTIKNEFEIIVRNQSVNTNSQAFLTMDANISRRHSMDTSQLTSTEPTNNTVIKSQSTLIYPLHQTSTTTDGEKSSITKVVTPNEESPNLFSHRQRASLLPHDPGMNGTGSIISVNRQNSNESDESDSLSQYFNSTLSRKSSSMTPGEPSIVHERSQSVIPITNYPINSSNRLQNFLKSDPKRPSRGSTSTERKSSLSFASLKFLKKKTKSVDFSHQKNFLINQLCENNYVGDIELQISHDSEHEQLVVRIIRAKNLLPKDTNGFSDPFVKIYLLPGRDQENKRRIKYVSKTLNPVWDQTVIYGHMHREELQYKKLEMTVWDYDRFKANDFLGQVTIDLKNPDVINDKPHWYRLLAFRSREETTNRGSSPHLFKMASIDSSASSTLTINKNSINIQPRTNLQK